MTSRLAKSGDEHNRIIARPACTATVLDGPNASAGLIYDRHAGYQVSSVNVSTADPSATYGEVHAAPRSCIGDVAVLIENHSLLHAQIKVEVKCTVARNGQPLEAPLPVDIDGAYGGQKEWNMPARYRIVGHFCIEEHTRKLSSDDRIALTVRLWSRPDKPQDVKGGQWDEIPAVSYEWNWDRSFWMPSPCFDD